MQLLNSEEKSLGAANYAFNAVMTSGTVSLMIKIGDGPYAEIEGANYIQDANGILRLPSCTIKAVITGDAVVHMLPQSL